MWIFLSPHFLRSYINSTLWTWAREIRSGCLWFLHPSNSACEIRYCEQLHMLSTNIFSLYLGLTSLTLVLSFPNPRIRASNPDSCYWLELWVREATDDLVLWSLSPNGSYAVCFPLLFSKVFWHCPALSLIFWNELFHSVSE